MGELHLEIVFNRLRREFGLQPYQGPVQVAYRERPVESGTITHAMERTFSGKPQVRSLDEIRLSRLLNLILVC